MKGGETLALNERIMLSLVSTGVSLKQHFLSSCFLSFLVGCVKWFLYTYGSCLYSGQWVGWNSSLEDVDSRLAVDGACFIERWYTLSVRGGYIAFYLKRIGLFWE